MSRSNEAPESHQVGAAETPAIPIPSHSPTLAAEQTRSQKLALDHGLTTEDVETFIKFTAEDKARASSALRDEEHALALDPATMGALQNRMDLGGALALVEQLESLAPKDEIERMIVMQLIAMNGLTLRATRSAHKTDRIDHYRDYVNAANKSSRTFTTLLEALNRHRGKSREQKVTVEHVHVHEGGQAIVGNVTQRGGGGGQTQKE